MSGHLRMPTFVMTMQPSVQRFHEAASACGLNIEITTFVQPTRTAHEAAEAIGCTVAQIVKSLCFTVNDVPVMALVSGDNQLDTGKLARLMGVGKKKVKRADPDTVRRATGYAIGGVAPLGHNEPMPLFVDEDLLVFTTIWAAAGTPHSVFPIAPATLVTVANGRVADLKKVL